MTTSTALKSALDKIATAIAADPRLAKAALAANSELVGVRDEEERRCGRLPGLSRISAWEAVSMRRVAVAFVAAALTVGLSGATVLGQPAPPGVELRLQTNFRPTTSPPAVFDLLQIVVDFPPGSAVPMHTHGGEVFVTVLEGEVVHVEDGHPEERFRAGQSWTEQPGVYGTVINRTGVPARLFATSFLPKGATFLIPREGAASGRPPPGPVFRTEFMTEVRNPAGPYEVVHAIFDFPAGSTSAAHTHGGPGFVTVLEGALQRRHEGVEVPFPTGTSWVEPGGPHAAGNRGQALAKAAVTFLLPQGAGLTTAITEPRARDGWGLSTESFATRAAFATVWGGQAAERWVQEHNADLARQGR